jgi:hypothetical protein
MHLFDHVENLALAKVRLSPSTPLDHCWCFSMRAAVLHLAINIRTGVAAPASI